MCHNSARRLAFHSCPHTQELSTTYSYQYHCLPRILQQAVPSPKVALNILISGLQNVSASWFVDKANRLDLLCVVSYLLEEQLPHIKTLEQRAFWTLDVALTPELFLRSQLEAPSEHPTVALTISKAPSGSKVCSMFLIVALHGVSLEALRSLGLVAARTQLDLRNLTIWLAYRPDVPYSMQIADSFILLSRVLASRSTIISAITCGEDVTEHIVSPLKSLIR